MRNHRWIVFGAVIAFALACGGEGKKKKKDKKRAEPDVPEQTEPAPKKGKVQAKRQPWCFTHPEGNTRIHVQLGLSHDQVEGGWIRFDDPKRGAVEAPITGGKASKSGMQLEVESPKGKTLPVSITIDRSGKTLTVKKKTYPGDLQNIACSDLE